MSLLVFWFYQHIVCCSHASRASFPTIYRGLAGHKLHVIQNGVDVDRVEQTLQALENDRFGEVFTVVTVGRLIILRFYL